jgi:hypothetical protein
MNCRLCAKRDRVGSPGIHDDLARCEPSGTTNRGGTLTDELSICWSTDRLIDYDPVGRGTDSANQSGKAVNVIWQGRQMPRFAQTPTTDQETVKVTGLDRYNRSGFASSRRDWPLRHFLAISCTAVYSPGRSNSST